MLFAELAARVAVDPDAQQPKYAQLWRRLEELIRQGELPVGLRLPPERKMSRLLGVSLITVKRAYMELRNRELISSEGRRGTIVRQPSRLEPDMNRLKGFTEEMRELGMRPSTRLLSSQVCRDPAIAALFSRPGQSPLLRVARVRCGDDRPLSREVAWYDLSVVPELQHADLQGSLYAFIREHCGVRLDWCEQSVQAVMSSEEENAIFEYEQPQPCLLLKRKTYCGSELMVEYVEGVFRGDAYVYRLRLDT
jgi:GntR family transcriptional regulator